MVVATNADVAGTVVVVVVVAVEVEVTFSDVITTSEVVMMMGSKVVLNGVAGSVETIKADDAG